LAIIDIVTDCRYTHLYLKYDNNLGTWEIVWWKVFWGTCVLVYGHILKLELE